MKSEIIRFVFYIKLLCLGFLMLAVVSLNARPVVFDYFFDANYVPLSLLLVFALMLGSVIGFMLSLWLLIQLKQENKSLKQRVHGSVQAYDEAPEMPVEGVL